MSEDAVHPKIDVKKTMAGYRAPTGTFALVELADQRYLMIDGRGDPNTAPAYARALVALYPVAYALKFASRRELGRDYVVPPLEGLWWADDMNSFTGVPDKSRWQWTMMLMVPDWIGSGMVDEAVARTADKAAGERLEGLREVRLQTLSEGLCVQTLHLGSFDDEGPVLERMHDVFIPEHGLQMTGRHHEIYLSDPRRVAPEKLRTILRQPVLPR